MTCRGHVAPGFLLALGVSAVLVTGCGSDSEEAAAGETAAAELAEVTVVSGAPPAGKLANLVVSQKRGYFRDEGIALKISLLGESSAAMKLVGSGRAEIGMVNSQDQIGARARGIPFASLATTAQKPTHGLMAPAGSGITEPSDLEGHVVGITGLPGNKATLEEVLRKNGADPGKIEFVEVGFDGPEALAAGTVDALGDAASWNIPARYNLIKGKPPEGTSSFTYVPFTDLGAHTYYSFSLATSERYLAENEDTVSGFMRAWQKGLEWSIANPEEAARLTVEAYPELDEATVLAQWKDLAKNATSPDTEAHGLGWQNPEVFREEAEFLHEAGIIEQPVDTSTMVRNEYLPGAK